MWGEQGRIPYWCFRLGPVVRRIQYLEEVKKTRSYWDLVGAIDAFRCRCPVTREPAGIPDASFGRRLSR